MPGDSLYGSDDGHSEDDNCGEAVVAAMEAIADHCGESRQPVELSSGQVMMVPDGGMDDLEMMAPGEMSDQEVIEMVENSPWMSGVIERNCTMAGHDEGTRGYRECVVNFGRELMDAV